MFEFLKFYENLPYFDESWHFFDKYSWNLGKNGELDKFCNFDGNRANL